ncbi:zinc finger protein 816 [Eurytemora carolleeae]|uniref:zinc finger protein 816 n=1 Tax=Eurytemora carolleeae TaxID=1294199 RepID=UPI000C78BD37|nr:zinc finger protein 816 [Eurytemora carolleeae]XP_023337050.1 zinc finger protein 816 [Eurytemora carolleeae]XP_023337051.1 zinc finger protein 816 [Eurytemora carolleeae]XP_023337052.1 zinc finger protein 816 [Eurytemora carolleeae]|eukprot:XP_023337049.1 zinc finger protein 816-like [Eurytemora affinis]
MFPITRGYTINVVKEKNKSAILILNSEPSNSGFVSYKTDLAGKELESNDLRLYSCNANGAGVHMYKGECGGTSSICTRGSEYMSTIQIEDQEDDEKSLDNEPSTGNCILQDSDILYETEERISCSNLELNSPIQNNTASENELYTNWKENISIANEEIVLETDTCSDVKDVDNERVFCEQCSLDFTSIQVVRQHLQDVHAAKPGDSLARCEYCGVLCTDRLAHMRRVHYSNLTLWTRDGKTYTCKECEYTSTELTNIRNHIDAKHSSEDKKHKCLECNTTYKTLNSIRAHRSRVHARNKKRKNISIN